MQLQYLETLKHVGMAPSTKIVVPMDLLSGLVNGLGGSLPAEPSNGSRASDGRSSDETGAGAGSGTRAELDDGVTPDGQHG